MSEISDEMVRWTLIAFENGEDTAGMAQCWFEHKEADFERALHIGLERRRAGRLAAEMGANV